jgi:glycosyltransferase involved in cell wall biosynthesis
VLAQTFRDFECLILDDGSTDGSGKIADDLARRDPRVRVVHRENRGLVATLNELVELARGDLVARMDADDVCLPTRFARQVEFLEQHPGAVCVGCGYWLVDEVDRTIAQIKVPSADDALQQALLRGHSPISHPTAMIRTAALRRLGGYRREFYPAEDLDLWLRLGELGTLANLADPLIRYRVHSGSISGQATQGRQRDAARRACADAWARRGVADGRFEATNEWRPDETAASRMRFALQYGWMAYSSGFRRTALVYGLKAIRTLPLRLEGWRLLAIALLRSPRTG